MYENNVNSSTVHKTASSTSSCLTSCDAAIFLGGLELCSLVVYFSFLICPFGTQTDCNTKINQFQVNWKEIHHLNQAKDLQRHHTMSERVSKTDASMRGIFIM